MTGVRCSVPLQSWSAAARPSWSALLGTTARRHAGPRTGGWGRRRGSGIPRSTSYPIGDHRGPAGSWNPRRIRRSSTTPRNPPPQEWRRAQKSRPARPARRIRRSGPAAASQQDELVVLNRSTGSPAIGSFDTCQRRDAGLSDGLGESRSNTRSTRSDAGRHVAAPSRP